MVYVFLAEGFEEVEALTIVDYLRRGGVEVKTVSISGSLEVMGTHGVEVKADILMTEANFDKAQMIVLPGGLPGADYLRDCMPLRKQIQRFAAEGSKDTNGKMVAAICAAPKVLEAAGILDGKKITCYPGVEKAFGNVKYLTDNVVVDGNIITSRGPSTAVCFALKLLDILKGDAVMQEVKAGLLL